MKALRPASSLFLLTLALAAPCLALGRSTAPVAPRVAERGDLLGQLRFFLVSLWNAAGCELDPFGRCLPGIQTNSPHLPTAGCELDPLGRCAPGTAASRVSAARAGCEIDPWGRCLPGTSTRLKS